MFCCYNGNLNYNVFFVRVVGSLTRVSGAVLSYKVRYIVGFWLVEMAISTYQKPTIYRNLYDTTGPGRFNHVCSENNQNQYVQIKFTSPQSFNMCRWHWLFVFTMRYASHGWSWTYSLRGKNAPTSTGRKAYVELMYGQRLSNFEPT